MQERIESTVDYRHGLALLFMGSFAFLMWLLEWLA